MLVSHDSRTLFTLVLQFRWLMFMNVFYIVNVAIKQQQYCNTVRPQLNSDCFAQNRRHKHSGSKGYYFKINHSPLKRLTSIFTTLNYCILDISVKYFDINDTISCWQYPLSIGAAWKNMEYEICILYRNREVWKLICCIDDHKTIIVFFTLVIYIHVRSFRWFHSIILKIYTIFQYVKNVCILNNLIPSYVISFKYHMKSK